MTFLERAKELVSKMTLAEKVSQMCYTAPAIERLGIPAYNWWNEALHGVARAGTATVFPQAIGMAASFDKELMKKVGDVISTEGRAKYNEFRKYGETLQYQGLTFWSPNINIFRDPRWGRGHETYGEDPYLTGHLAEMFIKGVQGEGKYRKADATLKHFAVHSGPEALRHSFDVSVSEKDLYETYLEAFRYCIGSAKPSAVMGAYNRVYGEPCCASTKLLKEILRSEFGFDGYVVSDCGAICDIHTGHKVTNGPAESAALAVNAGCDLNCGSVYPKLVAAVGMGLIDEETITKSVERLFEARFRLGMFDDDCEYDNIPYSANDCEEHRQINLRMARESIVLLKNDGILPLDKKTNVALIGPNAESVEVLLGNYYGIPSKRYTVLDGIFEKCEGRVNYAISKVRDDYIEEAYIREAVIAARNSDVVIMAMGLNPSMESEENSNSEESLCGDRRDIELPAFQKKLYERVLEAGKPIIFVNVSGSAVNLRRQDDSAAAVLQCFYPGAMGGLALAEIIFGEQSPCGRLPVTFYETVDDLPPIEDYSMENRTYKFYKGRPVYPFGYGLSYSEIIEEWLDDKTVKLTNKGKYGVNYTALRFRNEPHKELTGFEKCFLKAGESRTVVFS